MVVVLDSDQSLCSWRGGLGPPPPLRRPGTFRRSVNFSLQGFGLFFNLVFPGLFSTSRNSSKFSFLKKITKSSFWPPKKGPKSTEIDKKWSPKAFFLGPSFSNRFLIDFRFLSIFGNARTLDLRSRRSRFSMFAKMRRFGARAGFWTHFGLLLVPF